MMSAGSPTRKCWYAMLLRCDGKVFRERYFDRGITVCDEWRDFRNFLRDMGERPDGMTLERVNNDLGYSPENCKWASWHVQSRNRRSTLKISFNGEVLCGRDAAIRANVPESTIYRRKKKGVTDPEDLLAPARPRFRMITYGGETLCAKEWAKRFSLKYETFIRRLESGWGLHDALNTPTRKLTKRQTP